MKFLKNLSIVIGLVFCLILTANEIVYKVSIPESMKKSNWKGKWDSKEYKLISGRILTTIPEKSNFEIFEFNSQTLIYYNLWSLFKPGQSQIVELTGNFSEQNLKGDNLIQAIKNKDQNQHRTFKAKIQFDNGQYIEYDGTKSNMNKNIKGEYDSFLPADSGTFNLTKK